MKVVLTICLCALILSGCIAHWKNPNGPQRWSGVPGNSPRTEYPAVNPSSHSGPNGPQP